MSLEFRHIAFDYGSVRALSDIDLVAPRGEISCLLGSSGCGKTTLLNLAAGLLRVQTGEILLDGTLLADAHTHPAPEKRPLGLVFQEGALFPHMTVGENIVFGVSREARKGDVAARWLDRVGLPGMADRYPHMLSGGQQQRVALARAMAPEPSILLMDEPFASADIVLRRRLRRDCRRLIRDRGASAILVTHDPEEAMDMGDRIAVMDGGRIVQAGTPEELYDRPASIAVGRMFGDADIVPATPGDGGLSTPFGLWTTEALHGPAPTGDAFDLLVRRGALRLTGEGDLAIVDIRRVGGHRLAEVANAAGDRLRVEVATGGEDGIAIGERVGIAPKARSLRAFSRD